MKRLCALCRAAAARPSTGHAPASVASAAAASADRAAAGPPRRPLVTAYDLSSETLQRSYIFDLPELGTDGQPLRVRKWRRRSIRDGDGGAGLGGGIPDRDAGADADSGRGAADGQAGGLRTRYRHRASLKPPEGPPTDLWGTSTVDPPSLGCQEQSAERRERRGGTCSLGVELDLADSADRMLRSPKRQCMVTRTMLPRGTSGSRFKLLAWPA